MTTFAYPPKNAITYRQYLLNRIAEPGTICGPPVIDDRAWWQYLPWLNPYHELEQRARTADRTWAASSDADTQLQREAELEAGS